MQRLVENANQGARETRNKALWTLSNVCTTGTENHVMALIQCEGLQPFTEVLSLKNADATILCAALDAIERVLEVSNCTRSCCDSWKNGDEVQVHLPNGAYGIRRQGYG
jgi:hypothetical protein